MIRRRLSSGGQSIAVGAEAGTALPARHARVLHEFRRYAMPVVVGERCVGCPPTAPTPTLIYDGRCEACHVEYYKLPRYRVPQPPAPPKDDE